MPQRHSLGFWCSGCLCSPRNDAPLAGASCRVRPARLLAPGCVGRGISLPDISDVRGRGAFDYLSHLPGTSAGVTPVISTAPLSLRVGFNLIPGRSDISWWKMSGVTELRPSGSPASAGKVHECLSPDLVLSRPSPGMPRPFSPSQAALLSEPPASPPHVPEHGLPSLPSCAAELPLLARTRPPGLPHETPLLSPKCSGLRKPPPTAGCPRHLCVPAVAHTSHTQHTGY